MAPPGLPEAEATWEPVDTFHGAFPTFQLEDELFVEGGRDVMVGVVYVSARGRDVCRGRERCYGRCYGQD